MGTLCRDPTIDRERAQKRQQHQEDRRHRRQCARGEKGNTGLIAERGKIINTREAHYFVPGVATVKLLLALERSFDLLDRAFQQPTFKSGLLPCWLRQLGGRRHSLHPCDPETIQLLRISRSFYFNRCEARKG